MNEIERSVLEQYQSVEALNNQALYALVDSPDKELTAEVGESGKRHNLFYRKIRWIQQSLKQLGLLENIGRGKWSITTKGKIKLSKINDDSAVIAFSTNLGVAIWGSSKTVIKQYIDEPIHLCITSPPYPLQNQRAYGSAWEDEKGYVDFICESLEPVVSKLVSGGSIVLNVGNDVFNKGKPSRSLYLERLILTIHDRLGLELMDRHIWKSNKAPSPLIWSSIKRIQLNAQYEHILWFSNDSLNSLASIDRVLEPHTETHERFVKAGGTKSNSLLGDGAYSKRAGDYSKPTKGKIPHNCFYKSNYCKSGRNSRQKALELGLPPHSAKMPISIPEFYIKYLTERGQTVGDIFAGTLTTGEAAEKLGRHWIGIDNIREYLLQGFSRFNTGWINPNLV